MVKWILSPWDWLHPSQNPNDAHILRKWCSECSHIPDSTSKKLARHKSCSNGVQAARTQKSILAEPVRLEQRLDRVQPTSLTKSSRFGLLRSTLPRDNPGILEHWGTTWGMKRCFMQWSSPAMQRGVPGLALGMNWGYASRGTHRLRHFSIRTSKFLCYCPSQQWFYFLSSRLEHLPWSLPSKSM